MHPLLRQLQFLLDFIIGHNDRHVPFGFRSIPLERSTRPRRLAMALPHRGPDYPCHRTLLVLHDAGISSSNEDLVPAQGMVY